MGSHREVEAIDRQGTPRTKMAMILIMFRVGQNRLHAPYMTVYSVISLPEIPCIHHLYMVLATLSKFIISQQKRRIGLKSIGVERPNL
jgi:hypothetical protein